MRIRVLNAVIDGRTKGALLDVNAASAAHLVRIGYAEYVADKAEVTTAEPAEAETKPKRRRRG